jgi:hypothetical protein
LYVGARDEGDGRLQKKHDVSWDKAAVAHGISTHLLGPGGCSGTPRRSEGKARPDLGRSDSGGEGCFSCLSYGALATFG